MTWGLQLMHIGSSRACITYRHKQLERSIIRHFLLGCYTSQQPAGAPICNCGVLSVTTDVSSLVTSRKYLWRPSVCPGLCLVLC